MNTLFSTVVSFFKSFDFQKALLIAVAVVLPLVVSYYSGAISVGIAMTLGVLMSSPSDIRGSSRRRVLGIVISIVIAVSASLIMGYAAKFPIVHVLFLGLLIFFFSLISVYGFRASLVSFSGSFAIVLSLANISSESSILVHSFLIGCGGIWYLALSIVFHSINPKRHTEELLADILSLTGEYLRIRSLLIDSPAQEQKALKEKLPGLHSELNEKHEALREVVISRRRKSGKSISSRKKLLMLIELVDILELGMSNPVNYDQMEALFVGHQKKLRVLKEWSLLMAEELEVISTALRSNRKYKPNPDLKIYRGKVKSAICEWSEEEASESSVAFLTYRGLYHFKEKQYEKLIAIERLVGNIENQKLPIKSKEAHKFIPTQEYSLKILKDNFNFKSSIFRHSLRLTVVVLIGFFVGITIELQNAYWILLTSLVIMRPGYGLTKERFKQRLYGTLIGGIIAASIVFLTQNTVLFGILAIVTLVLALAMIQKNYKTAATLITLNVVFVYSLIRSDAYEVIQFRVLDTIIGAALAFLGNTFLWPSWEYKGIKITVAESIRANLAYLDEIDVLYQKTGQGITRYKLSRKDAFLAMGTLNAAFQRMNQEPKSKQKELESIYEVVTLNQELLSSLASLGAFIRTHPTTEPSKHYKTYISVIRNHLLKTVAELQEMPLEDNSSAPKVEGADLFFETSRKKLTALREKQIREGEAEIAPEMSAQFQESQLVVDQLKWLLQISESLQQEMFKRKQPK